MPINNHFYNFHKCHKFISYFTIKLFYITDTKLIHCLYAEEAILCPVQINHQPSLNNAFIVWAGNWGQPADKTIK